MKKTLLFTMAILILLALPVGAYTSELSYGIGVLRKEVGLKKCGVSGEEIRFEPLDFEEAMGVERLSALCILSLPDEMLGTLRLGEDRVYSGQVVEREDIASLRFVPCGFGEYSVNFEFSDGRDSAAAYACTLNMVEGGNSAPVASDAEYSTQSGIELIKTLSAYDPDGDSIEYTLTSVPKKGRLRIIDAETGSFSYLPDGDAVGKDSFSYTVSDRYGNRCDEVTVTVTVEKPACDVFYSDMNGNPHHNSAIKLAAAGLMTGESIGGVSYFYPEEQMSRATFLRLCMQANGVGAEADEGALAVFGDSGTIADYDKPYVSYALEAGYVSGIETEEGTVFAPLASITVGEAVTVLDRIVGTGAVITGAFSEDALGHWADAAYCNLLAKGFIEPCADLDEPLTRAVAAQMLCACIG